jgi:phenylpropionate dioxygenase-like ring-hydroxylating dioxygenase large terminal subunit
VELLLVKPTIVNLNTNNLDMFLALKQDIANYTAAPLTQHNNNLSLVHADQFYMISNVCPHQNSRIACEPTQQLKCPYHGLEYSLAGEGIDHDYELETLSCYTNQTMLFDQRVDCVFPVDTQYMQLMQQREDIVQATPNVIMDVFLDVEHIPVAHSGVYDSIGITRFDNLKFSFFDQGSLQTIPLQDKQYIHEDDLHYNISACWMAVYPGTMIEWQPGALFVTVALPDSKGSRVQVYKYRDIRYSMLDWSNNSIVWETAWEQDRALAENIIAPATANIDELKQHHRAWMRRNAM